VLALACCTWVFAQETPALKLSDIAPEHGFLERMSGRWNTTLRFWTSEKDTAALQLNGKSVCLMDLDGRLLIEQDSTRIQSRIYRSFALLTFDAGRHQYVETWVDKTNPGMLMLTGALNDSGNVLTLRGERENPKSAKTSVELIYRFFNGNYRMLQMWETPQSGKKRETMEITYTRGL